MKKWLTVVSFLLVVVAMIAGTAAFPIGAADHLDAPLVQQDGRIDINDVYAFTRGNDTVMVMTVNPLAGVNSPVTLRFGAFYEFAVDTNGDAEEDIVYRLVASEPDDAGRQLVTLFKSSDNGRGHPVVAAGTNEAVIPVDGGGKLFVGLRDDPFFFDLVAFRNGLAFCQTDPAPDFFASLNVTAIVLQVPNEALGSNASIGIWGRVRLHNKQIERTGRPVINTVLIPSGSKDEFNRTDPSQDVAKWRATAINSLVSLNGDPAYSAAVADVLLPDILTIDRSAPSGYLNGRALADDVIDLSLAVVSKGAITTDCVDGNDKAFLSSFPYLAEPHP